jgi:hypothetical protein
MVGVKGSWPVSIGKRLLGCPLPCESCESWAGLGGMGCMAVSGASLMCGPT